MQILHPNLSYKKILAKYKVSAKLRHAKLRQVSKLRQLFWACIVAQFGRRSENRQYLEHRPQFLKFLQIAPASWQDAPSLQIAPVFRASIVAQFGKDYCKES